METFSALLALCAGNSPVTGEFPTQRPVMQSFDVSFDLHLNKQFSCESGDLRRHRAHYDVIVISRIQTAFSIYHLYFNPYDWLLCNNPPMEDNVRLYQLGLHPALSASYCKPQPIRCGQQD